MASSELRRRDTTKGTPLRILSLDGGGVRGYSILIILANFMYKVGSECAGGEAPNGRNLPKPCDYFDLIAGTGTGGLIAIMLGRLRMDIKDCMDVYAEMTRRVFETDKTIAGIPYRHTLFKASKLEDAIKDCVREYEKGSGPNRNSVNTEIDTPTSPTRRDSMYSNRNGRPTSSLDANVGKRLSTMSSTRVRPPRKSDALLYDSRPNRTKTAVTAVLKGDTAGNAVFLRSYESPAEPSIEPDCTIWQAGRATSATGIAFKPIQIGKSIFLDEGSGHYNPAPQVLEEAVKREWPGRNVAVFLSIGTGMREKTATNTQWWEGLAGGMSEFVEAKKRLIAKIEGCETTHKRMLKEGLGEQYLSAVNYFRLNVDEGVGDYAMNEWSRLTEISTNTNIYLARQAAKETMNRAVQAMSNAEKQRRPQAYSTRPPTPICEQDPPSFVPPPDSHAVELPGVEIESLYPRPLSIPGPQYPAIHPYTYQQQYSSQEKFTITPAQVSRYADQSSPRHSDELPYRSSNECRRSERPESSDGSRLPSPRKSIEGYAPPLPPKTPIPFADTQASRPPEIPRRRDHYLNLPYPDNDGPPPVVNLARKPEYIRR